jgi:CDP-paratose 2-epimerase
MRMLEEIGSICGEPVRVRHEAVRAGDQRWFVADTRRARAALDLPEPIGWRAGLRDLADWLRQQQGASARYMEAVR